MKKITFALFLLFAIAMNAVAQEANVHINQMGFYPHQEKVAIVEGVKMMKKYSVKDASGNTIHRGILLKKDTYKSAFSEEQAYHIDLSSIIRPGEYTLDVNKTQTKFVVKNDVLEDMCKAAIKAFYYQRSAMPIEPQFAGQWSRPAAHMDTEVLVHPSAATKERPAGTKISSSKGWYDAGDYNKYIVNSGFTIGQMLNIYPLVEEYLKDLNVNIPESGNGVPDILNEIYYNLEWMFTMQDTDGGLYHKLTTPNFEGFVMPKDCKQQRYVVQKSTCATLDFAAVMALASRIYAPYEKQFPGFSKKAIEASKRAYLWALQNPEVYYNQYELNKNYTPKINTGTYGDNNAKDEFFWAAVELYLTTGSDMFLKELNSYMPETFSVPVWGDVSALGLTSWIIHYNCKKAPRTYETLQVENYAKEIITEWSDKYIKNAENTMFMAPFGAKKSDFHWASMAEGAATEALVLIQTYVATKDKKYLINARRNADYLLGKNPLDYCYVTGFGTKSPKNPHHRISAADGIAEPVPGLLVGGPNATANEGDYYSSEQPDKRYADNVGSYTSNEIAINWNSALVALTAALQYYQEY